jgi:hypothetical protein
MCNNCENCIHNRVCGHKEKYQQYIKEYNELNKKWDIFDRDPNCPEYTDKSLLKVNYKKYFDTKPLEDKDIKVTYDSSTNKQEEMKMAEKLYNKNINKDIPPAIDLDELIEKILLVNTLRNRKNSGVRY